jgi:hypothetical protein
MLCFTDAMLAARNMRAQAGRLDVLEDAIERIGGNAGSGDDDHAVLAE